MIVPKIKNVKPSNGFNLLVTFDNGTIKEFDVEPYIKDFKAFSPIKNKTLFDKVYVDAFGFSIAWNEDIDIDRYDVWEFGQVLVN